LEGKALNIRQSPGIDGSHLFQVEAQLPHPAVRFACQHRWPVLAVIDQHVYEVQTLERIFRLENASSVTLPDFSSMLLAGYENDGEGGLRE
jgi:hypothetical protein